MYPFYSVWLYNSNLSQTYQTYSFPYEGLQQFTTSKSCFDKNNFVRSIKLLLIQILVSIGILDFITTLHHVLNMQGFPPWDRWLLSKMAQNSFIFLVNYCFVLLSAKQAPFIFGNILNYIRISLLFITNDTASPPGCIAIFSCHVRI